MFLNFLHHVQKSPWVIGLVDLGVLDTLKKKKKREIQRPFGLRSRRKGDFGWSKVKVSGLHLLWLDVKSVKGRKEGKDEELNREAIRPFGQRWRKRSEVPKVWRLGAVLRSCVSESKQESKRKIESFLHLFLLFLPFTLFTSSHNKCKSLTLTLLQPKSLFLLLLRPNGLCIFLFFFSSACPTLLSQPTQ